MRSLSFALIKTSVPSFETVPEVRSITLRILILLSAFRTKISIFSLKQNPFALNKFHPIVADEVIY
jgi:hypothetical protein